MSFTKDKRSTIKHYMMEKISEGDPEVVQKSVDAFAMTKNTAYRYLRELTEEGCITRRGRRFLLVSHKTSFHIDLSQLTEEDDDRFFMEHVYSMLEEYPENVQHIWYYCFTEMMNNILEHSGASSADITIITDPINTRIILSDDGVGIFQKIREFYGFSTLDDAILELFKGKLTTDQQNHSGEGIFFTSRIMDLFAAVSDDKLFSHTEYTDLLADLESEELSLSAFKQGTTILMRLSNNSSKTTKEIMDRFSDEDGDFTKTEIPIKNVFPTYPVSRSQAKRLCHRFESFSEVKLDFSGVSEIGQGFAHELFVVYHSRHPEVTLIPTNTGKSIERMIRHVTGKSHPVP